MCDKNLLDSLDDWSDCIDGAELMEAACWDYIFISYPHHCLDPPINICMYASVCVCVCVCVCARVHVCACVCVGIIYLYHILVIV